MNKNHYFALVIAAGLTVAGLSTAFADHPQIQTYNIITKKDRTIVGTYQIPLDSTIQDEPNADAILYGKRLLNETARLLPDNVGSQMNCNSCHIAQGKAKFGAHYINSVNTYPKLMPRSGKQLDLAGRVNGCFQRSMNGKPIEVESNEMQSILAYMQWLAKEVPPGHIVDIPIAGELDESLVPDPQRGKQLYAAQCASCHGMNGEGMRDHLGIMAFPPLWGDESFNIGAGLARTYKAAAFIKYNMPMSVSINGEWGQGGVLNDQDAVDIAEYFTHMPRPDFPPKVNDWPNGKKPKDARY